MELLEAQKPTDTTTAAPTVPSAALAPEPSHENNQNLPNKPVEAKSVRNGVFQPSRRDSLETAANIRPPVHPTKPPKPPVIPNPPPVAKALPMPANHPAVAPTFPANQPRPPRPNSNVSFVLQPLMGGVGMVPPLYAPPPRLPPPHLYSNYYEYSGPWHFACDGFDRHHNVNLNFNLPPKNLVVNGKNECKNACAAEGEPVQYAAPQGQGCWIKPTIFYDGFWTEQKVKKWVAEQVEKQFPEDGARRPSPPGQP